MWYGRMVPALLPFMILSNLMVYMNVPKRLCRSPLIYPVFVGFLCGFPLGAKATASLYQEGLLTKKEAHYLLGFCNLLGPSYILGFVLPLLQISPVLPCLIGIYGIPLLDGLLCGCLMKIGGSSAGIPKVSAKTGTTLSFSRALARAVADAVQAILQLCGYVVIFQTLLLLPRIFFPKWEAYLAPFLEIGSGLSLLGNTHPLLSLCAVSFGGLCCYVQTLAILSDTDLSARSYLVHKCLQMLGTFFYFLLIKNALVIG